MFKLDVSFQETIQSLQDNVCNITEEDLDQITKNEQTDQFRSGILQYQSMIREVIIEMGKTSQDYETVIKNIKLMFSSLYTICLFGNCEYLEGYSTLKIDNSCLSASIKSALPLMTNMSKPMFWLKYFKNETPTTSLKSSTSVVVGSQYPDLLFSLSKAVQHIPPKQKNTYYTDLFHLFLKADFPSIIGSTSVNKTEINPFRSDIINMLKGKQDLWKMLLQNFISRSSYQTSCSFYFFKTPKWIVHLLYKNKPLFIFNLVYNKIFMEFSIPYLKRKDIIAGIQNFSPTFRAKMLELECAKCGKCDGSSIEEINAVKICKNNPYCRRLNLFIETEDDVKTIILLAEYC